MAGEFLDAAFAKIAAELDRRRGSAKAGDIREMPVRAVEKEVDRLLFTGLTGKNVEANVAAYHRLVKQFIWLDDPNGPDLPSLRKVKAALQHTLTELDRLEHVPGTAKRCEALRAKAKTQEAEVRDKVAMFDTLRSILPR